MADERRTVLMIMGDESADAAYREYIDGDRYKTISAQELWKEEPGLTPGTAGPLNPRFMERLMNKRGTEFSAIIIGEQCEDLISTIKVNYDGPLIGVYLTNRRMKNVDRLVDTLSALGLSERINEALDKLVR
jgi:hypothetical protein